MRPEHSGRQALLIGSPKTRRTEYFGRAAQQAGLPVLLADWKQLDAWDWQQRSAWLVKIDPPVWDSCRLDELRALAEDYQKQLRYLSGLSGRENILFFNDPSVIMRLLDKRACKEVLVQAGLPVTEALCAGRGMALEELFARMQERKMYQVFIKPVYGSGAAGVSAFRWQPASGRMALYTCAWMHPDFGLVNTKRLRYFSDPEKVRALLGEILKQECIFEKWHAKAGFQGFSYDLRVVVQDKTVDFMLARLSKGPITNLQLNNRPLELSALGLPPAVLDAAADLCVKAAACFPGLRSAGADLLLEKGSLRPRMIEMNGQGDLIYQDIFQENRIYRHQAEMIKEQTALRPQARDWRDCAGAPKVLCNLGKECQKEC